MTQLEATQKTGNVIETLLADNWNDLTAIQFPNSSEIKSGWGNWIRLSLHFTNRYVPKTLQHDVNDQGLAAVAVIITKRPTLTKDEAKVQQRHAATRLIEIFSPKVIKAERLKIELYGLSGVAVTDHSDLPIYTREDHDCFYASLTFPFEMSVDGQAGQVQRKVYELKPFRKS